ncbi:MAG: hypothetical protein AB1649_12795 [Chloroflexota bacterium]
MFNELTQTVNRWLRWIKLQRSLTWAERGLTLGLALGLIVGALGVWQARLLRSEFLSLVGAVTLVSPVVAGIIAYLWPLESVQAARKFENALHLKERISTALELNTGRGTPSRLLQQQLEDAVATTEKVKPARDLPLRLKPLETILALVLMLTIGLVWFRGEAMFKAAQHARDVQQAVETQAEQIEEILTQIENNEALTEEQKQALSEPLEQALNELQENPSLEGAVSVLTSTGEQLQALSDEQTEHMSQALQQAGQNLAGQEGTPLQSMGQELAQGDTLSAANELNNLDVSNLSAEEAQQLAQQLQSMAESVQATNPDLAQQLNDAAQALQQGNTEAAQQALNQAATELAEAGGQVTFSQAANQAAQQVQQGAGQVLAAGGGQQQGTQGQGSQAGSNQGQTPDGAAGSGSGSGGGENSPQTGNESGSAPIPQDNGPGDGGETAYEQIYAPSLIGGEGGPSVGLPDSGEDGTVVGEGPTTPSEPGESLVPYSEVYSQYDQANQHAIESGSVPFEFMQVIRNYFNSLKP